jgi:hypothetical protein
MVGIIREQGTEWLGISTGLRGKSFSISRLTAMRVAPGWIVDGAKIEEWRFQGFSTQEGEVWLYGPRLEGRPLSEVLEGTAAETLPFLARLTDALVLMRDRSIPPFDIGSDGVLFLADGRILFLPPALMTELRSMRTFAENRDTFVRISHPDWKGEAGQSFCLACLVYRAITGDFPFQGSGEEDIHDRVRKQRPAGPDRTVPDLKEDVGRTVMSCFSKAVAAPAMKGKTVETYAGPGLDEWKARMAAWAKDGILRPMSDQERASARKQAEAQAENAAKHYGRRRFWERNWRTVAVAAAGVLVLALIAQSILANVLAPRVTKGFPPRKIVETFYQSMNTLDQSAIEDCVVDKAGEGEKNEVVNLYVISRQVIAYEGKSNILPADEWAKKGRPALQSTQSVYGTVMGTLSEEQGEPHPVFLAEYEKWTPLSGDSDSASASTKRSEGQKVTDRLLLRQDKQDWVIYKIDRLSSVPIP